MVGRFKQFYYYYFVRSLFAPNSGFSEPDNDVKQPTARSGSFLSVLILTSHKKKEKVPTFLLSPPRSFFFNILH